MDSWSEESVLIPLAWLGSLCAAGFLAYSILCGARERKLQAKNDEEVQKRVWQSAGGCLLCLLVGFILWRWFLDAKPPNDKSWAITLPTAIGMALIIATPGYEAVAWHCLRRKLEKR